MLTIGIGVGGPKFSFVIFDKATGTWVGVTSLTTIVPGRIYHVVGSYDESKLRIYVNGALESTTEHPGQLAQGDASGGGLAINGWGRRPSSTFAGLLDNVAIYNKALPESEVRSHFLKGTRITYFPTVLADSPVAFWRLGEARGQSVVDSSGNGNAGSLAKVGVSSRPLVRGSTTSASFDGRASRMSFRPSKSLESGSGLSMEAWVDAKTVPSASKSGWALISEFSRGMLTMGGGVGGPKFSFVIFDKATGTWVGVTSLTTIVPGRIYHVVGSYDGSKLRIYVNGALESTTEHPGRLAQGDASGGGLAINGWGRRPSSTFAGLLDNVAIYDKALSVARVRLHYLQGRLS